MALVAFCPKGILAPSSFLVVMVPIGVVTELMWLDALADRVVNLVEKEPNPFDAAKWACRMLDCPSCNEPNQLGQYLVLDNWALYDQIHARFFDGNPFPFQVTGEDPDALSTIQNTDLETWVHSADLRLGHFD